MSNKYSLKKIIVLFLGLYLVVVFFPLHKNPSSKTIEWKSASSVKHTSKLSNPIGIHIQPVEGQEFQPGSPFQLIGTVILQSAAPELEIQWSLPEGVEVDKGETKTTITSPKIGQVYSFFLTILTNSEINQQIHFHGSIQVGEMRFGNGAIYNTSLQEKIDQGRQKLFDRVQAFSDK